MLSQVYKKSREIYISRLPVRVVNTAQKKNTAYFAVLSRKSDGNRASRKLIRSREKLPATNICLKIKDNIFNVSRQYFYFGFFVKTQPLLTLIFKAIRTGGVFNLRLRLNTFSTSGNLFSFAEFIKKI